MNEEEESENTFALNFSINNELTTIKVPLIEGDLIFKLTNDDEYTIMYIRSLISNGCISLEEPLQNIFRVDEEGSKLLYSVDTENGMEKENETEKENDTLEEKTNKTNERTDAETRLLLSNYELFISKVGPLKKFKTKKAMWNQIAEAINETCNVNRTGVQVENRYKTVVRRKKIAVENNHQSGASRMNVPYEEELSKITALDDSIQPELLRSSSGGMRVLKPHTKNLPCTSPLPSTSGATPKRAISDSDESGDIIKRLSRSKTIQDTMLEIHRQKEESREKRHREKLYLIREIFKKK